MNKQDKRCPQDAAIFVPAESLYGKRLVGSEFIKNKAFYDGDTFYVPNDALNDMDALDKLPVVEMPKMEWRMEPFTFQAPKPEFRPIDCVTGEMMPVIETPKFILPVDDGHDVYLRCQAITEVVSNIRIVMLWRVMWRSIQYDNPKAWFITWAYYKRIMRKSKKKEIR